jgi:hypothetical protein
MTIPAWADRALEAFRPGIAFRADGPNPARMAQWQGISERLHRRWAEIGADGWRVPDSHPSYSGLIRNGYLHPASEYVRQGILECAIESAMDLGSNKHPSDVINAVRRLDELNDEISELAGLLARKFRARQQCIDEFALTDRGTDADEGSPDPFDLFGALELALARPERVGHRIESFLAIAATGSNPNPTWAEMLDEASWRMPRIVGAMGVGDITEIGSTTKKTAWSPWTRRLLARLGGWCGNGLPDGFFLECLTNEQIATLAAVIFDAPGDAQINAEQIRKLRSRIN